jgi:hypothetical protein
LLYFGPFWFNDPAYLLCKKLAIIQTLCLGLPFFTVPAYILCKKRSLIKNLYHIHRTVFSKSWASFRRSVLFIQELNCFLPDHAFSLKKACLFFVQKLPVFDHPSFHMFKKIARTFNDLLSLMKYLFSLLIRLSLFAQKLAVSCVDNLWANHLM